MAGVDRDSWKWLGGWAHVQQSLLLIFTTAIGARVMRRRVGSAVPTVLGRSLTPARVLRFKTAIIVAIELWEPRFAVSFVHSEADSPENLRLGNLRLVIEGTYFPRGHLGDFSTEPVARSFVAEKGMGNL